MKSYLTIVCFLALFGVSEGVYSQSSKSYVRTRTMLNDNGGFMPIKLIILMVWGDYRRRYMPRREEQVRIWSY